MSLDTEAVALMNARADALNLADDLAEVADALRLVALGKAGGGDVVAVRGVIDAHGDLVVRGCLDWVLLLAHAGAKR